MLVRPNPSRVSVVHIVYRIHVIYYLELHCANNFFTNNINLYQQSQIGCLDRQHLYLVKITSTINCDSNAQL